MVWRGVAAAFAGWALVAALAPFPLATLPTMLGRRLSRAFGAFSVLYAAAALSLASGFGLTTLARRHLIWAYCPARSPYRHFTITRGGEVALR